MDDSCVWIGIGIDITPENEIYSQIITVCTQLSKQYGSTYPNPLHINLYDLDVPQDNLDKIDQVLRNISAQSTAFAVQLNSIKAFPHGTIYIDCDLNDKLKLLEKEVVEAVVPLKGDCRTEDYWQPWRQYNKQQLEYRDNYGNPHVLDAFRPHITIGFIKTDEDKLKQITQDLNKSFEPSEMKVGQIDMVIQGADGKTLGTRHYPFHQT